MSAYIEEAWLADSPQLAAAIRGELLARSPHDVDTTSEHGSRTEQFTLAYIAGSGDPAAVAAAAQTLSRTRARREISMSRGHTRGRDPSK